ncbi:MAG: helix-turn-helix domain-containing protein [Chloracidobacterium sp.]|nr:helix-turn-helix domain-containing protein [Chloracidobacterium sp.]
MTNDNDFITQNEAAEQFPVSTVTLWRERKEGRLPFYRVRGRVLYRVSDLIALFEAGRRNGAEAIEDEKK